jgi:3,4-dihydroxy-2-butanone 4-phosphate synthase/2-C-methyl-D-erythritol 4-phosphate cytidylyltransferase
MKIYGLVLAGGVGSRMQSKTPKQYLELNGKPILAHTLHPFLQCRKIETTIITVENRVFEEYKNTQTGYLLEVEKEIFTGEGSYRFISGGETRQESVWSGLSILKDVEKVDMDDLVIIHDGARPLLTEQDLESLIASLGNYDGVAPAEPLREDIVRLDENSYSEMLSRDGLRSLQTPMVFRFDVLYEACLRAIENKEQRTEETSLVKKIGGTVKIVEGSPRFFKVVYPQDIKILEKLQEYKEEEATIVSVEEAVEELKSGRGIIIADSEDRENEGDLMFLANGITTEQMNMLTKCRGIICYCMPPKRAEQLGLKRMVEKTDISIPAFTKTIDFIGCGSGTSAEDRALTIRKTFEDGITAKDFRSPGHVNPLIGHKDGLNGRMGHTEATLTLSKICGELPGSVICELLNEDGSMARMPQLKSFARIHGLKITTIDRIKEYAETNSIQY